MGYRSQVRSIIYGPDDKVTEFVAARKLIGGDLAEVWSETSTYLVAYGAETWRVLDLKCDDTKWYPNYPDVAAWMTMLDEAEEAGLQYEHACLGEDDTDTSRNCSTDNQNWLEVRREIYTYMPNKLQEVTHGPDAES